MGRDVPYDIDARCDTCGALGAYDFYGDYICHYCLSQSSERIIDDGCEDGDDFE